LNKVALPSTKDDGALKGKAAAVLEDIKGRMGCIVKGSSRGNVV
jgi:hypothetical protein